METAQGVFVFFVMLPLACIAIVVSVFVPKEQILSATGVVGMVYFVIGFVGYLRMYVKSVFSQPYSLRYYK